MVSRYFRCSSAPSHHIACNSIDSDNNGRKRVLTILLSELCENSKKKKRKHAQSDGVCMVLTFMVDRVDERQYHRHIATDVSPNTMRTEENDKVK